MRNRLKFRSLKQSDVTVPALEMLKLKIELPALMGVVVLVNVPIPQQRLRPFVKRYPSRLPKNPSERITGPNLYGFIPSRVPRRGRGFSGI
jgi:hypothetical protein